MKGILLCGIKTVTDDQSRRLGLVAGRYSIPDSLDSEVSLGGWNLDPLAGDVHASQSFIKGCGLLGPKVVDAWVVPLPEDVVGSSAEVIRGGKPRVSNVDCIVCIFRVFGLCFGVVGKL
ncbi:unnamed protein product [Periconia digitata]|uniref:Uncharacterized protein n=1 Tax=Periconia digitata TaxID=1303443 RepID=A0A9W4UJE1_9PLEO|nr:unnamed protein product [Periconia digitata]